MKRLFTLFIFACVTLGMSAATDYGFSVKGIKVTSDNASDILGDGKSRVIYNATNNYLWIKDGADISCDTTYPIYFLPSEEKSLTIYITGKSNISSKNYGCIFVGAKGTLSIYGASNFNYNGELTLTSNAPSSYSAISSYGKLFIVNCTVNVTSTNGYAIGGIGTNYCKSLTITGADVVAKGGIGSVSEFTLAEAFFKTPTDAKFDSSKKGIVSGSTIATDITIAPVNYLLRVGGVRVTGKNRSDILGDGKAYYFSSSNTLTLKDASITDGIITDSDMTSDFTIKLNGTNSVSNSSTNALFLFNESNTTITSDDGTGILNVSSTAKVNNYGAIKVFGKQKTLTIKKCTLNAQDSYFGIAGYQENKSQKLVIDNAKVKASGSYCCIGNFANVSLVGVDYIVPDGAFYNTSNSVVRDNKLNIATACEIGEKSYGIYLLGIMLNSQNYKTECAKYTGVSFNPVYYQLNLNNAVISASDASGSCIRSVVPMIIDVTGTCKVSNTSFSAITFDKNATIQGSGTLYVTSGGTSGDSDYPTHAIRVLQNSTVTIKDCHVIADASHARIARGIGACPKGEGTLIINGATVEATGYSNFAGIGGFKTLTLEGNVGIEVPTRGKYNTSSYYVADKTSNFAGEYVKVAPITTLAGIKIADNDITNIIAGDILDDGKLSYDYANGVLTLNGATIGNSSINNGISWTGSSKLKVLVTGESTINSGKNGIYVSSNGGLTIDGDGSSNVLNINTAYTGSDAYSPVNVNMGPLYVDECVLKLKGNKAGINSVSPGSNTLTLDDSEVIATLANGGAALRNFKTINLNQGIVNSSAKGITTTKAMTIITTHGMVDNEITASEQGIFTDCDVTETLTIKGSGSSDDLFIYSPSKSYGGIMSDGNIVIKDMDLSVSGYGYGIYGRSGDETLTVENAYVKASASSVTSSSASDRSGAIVKIKDIILNDAHFSNGTEFVAANKGVVFTNNPSIFADTVEIIPGAAAIEAVTLDEDNNAPAYDLRGVQVDKSYKGVVIKNGKKFMQK